MKKSCNLHIRNSYLPDWPSLKRLRDRAPHRTVLHQASRSLAPSHLRPFGRALTPRHHLLGRQTLNRRVLAAKTIQEILPAAASTRFIRTRPPHNRDSIRRQRMTVCRQVPSFPLVSLFAWFYTKNASSLHKRNETLDLLRWGIYHQKTNLLAPLSTPELHAHEQYSAYYKRNKKNISTVKFSQTYTSFTGSERDRPEIRNSSCLQEHRKSGLKKKKTVAFVPDRKP